MQTESTWVSHGGELSVHTHASDVCQCEMRFGVYAPPQAKVRDVPVLWTLWRSLPFKLRLQNMAS